MLIIQHSIILLTFVPCLRVGNGLQSLQIDWVSQGIESISTHFLDIFSWLLWWELFIKCDIVTSHLIWIKVKSILNCHLRALINLPSWLQYFLILNYRWFNTWDCLFSGSFNKNWFFQLSHGPSYKRMLKYRVDILSRRHQFSKCVSCKIAAVDIL